jgi:polysaccharide export outer membrane protein
MHRSSAVTFLTFALVFGTQHSRAQVPFAPVPVAPAPEHTPPSSAIAPDPPQVGETSSSVTHESLLIGPGDLLQITVLDESDLSRKVRVRDSGEITLPYIGNVQVGGLNTGEASLAVAQKYIDGQFLKHPEVSVFVEEYATQSVSVLGQVVHPGSVSISTGRSLVDVISMAGGLTDVADRHITIERGGASHGLVEVFLSNRPEDAFNANVEVFPGDKILVPKAGIVYVLGDVGRPGGYVMQNNSRMTVLQAVAIAAGVNRTASEGHARLIHNSNGKFDERELPLKEIEAGTAPDELLEADDVIYIPFSFGKNILMGTNSIVAATSSALIYAGR